MAESQPRPDQVRGSVPNLSSHLPAFLLGSFAAVVNFGFDALGRLLLLSTCDVVLSVGKLPCTALSIRQDTACALNQGFSTVATRRLVDFNSQKPSPSMGVNAHLSSSCLGGEILP